MCVPMLGEKMGCCSSGGDIHPGKPCFHVFTACVWRGVLYWVYDINLYYYTAFIYIWAILEMANL